MKTLPRLNPLFKLTPIFAVLAITGCNNDEDEIHVAPQTTSYAHIRVVHASPDAPAVNVLLNGTEAITSLDYAGSTGFIEIESAAYDIDVNGILPSSEVTVIDVDGFELAADAKSTVMAVGKVATIEPLVISPSSATPTDTQVSLQVVHAAPDAPAVDIFLTAPGTDITSIEPAFNFTFKDVIDVGAVAADQVQIRAVYDGDIVFDSGTVDLSTLAGQQLLVAAIAATTHAEKDASPIKLLAMTGSAQLFINDVDLGVGARVVHAAPDATLAAGGPVEVFATSEVLGMNAVELIDEFSYLDVFPTEAYAFIPAGTYQFDVGPNIDSVGGSVFNSGELELEAGKDYSVIATGRLTSDPAFTLLATMDNNRAIATQASVKVIHAAPAAGTVDVYVTPAGSYTAADVSSGMAGDPLLNDFAFSTITDYVAVEPGRYDIRVVAGGSVAINIEGFELASGVVANVIARGPGESGEADTDFSVIVTTN